VVANAGIAPTAATFRGMATERFKRVIDVNPTGVVKTVEAALPEMVRAITRIVALKPSQKPPPLDELFA
jgi:NAD(P)-dependent dehydrogenase (short-subunit alcohol dehydrogenase family)